MEEHGRRTPDRMWLFAIFVIAFAVLVVGRFTQIEELLRTLYGGRLRWVFAAAGLQVIFYIFYAALYQAAFATVNIRSHIRDLLPVTFASIFINSTAPSGGAAGLAVFVDDAKRRGESSGGAAAGMLLVLAVNHGVFGSLLLLGLVFLFRQNHLTIWELVSALVLFLFVGALVGMLALAAWRPFLLERVLGGFQRVVNGIGRRLRRPSILVENWAAVHAADFTEAAAAISRHPTRLLRAIALALITQAINILILACLFLAFRQPVTFGVVVTCYAMTMLFWIVSPTPNGVGVVETVMPLIYRSVGLTTEAGTIINLTFRGLSFWLPLFVGFILLRRLRLFQDTPQQVTETSAD